MVRSVSQTGFGIRTENLEQRRLLLQNVQRGSDRGILLVPVDVDPDCDADGIPDAQEFAEGTAFDANGNGLPDDCELSLVVSELIAGQIGELLVCGASAAEGYWNQRQKSRSTFEGHWTRTGDKYELTEDGRYIYCGRTDDMFKVSGIWVSPFEVEQALVSHPAVKLNAGLKMNASPSTVVLLKLARRLITQQLSKSTAKLSNFQKKNKLHESLLIINPSAKFARAMTLKVAQPYSNHYLKLPQDAGLALVV